MSLKKLKGTRLSIIILVCCFSIFLVFTASIIQGDNVNFEVNMPLSSQQNIVDQWFKESHEVQMIENSNFDNSVGWITESIGDVSDITADISNNEANYNVAGEIHTETLISGTPNSTSSMNWHNATNPEVPVYPTQGHGIDGNGCHASHLWAEHSGTTTNAYQKASVQWEKVITMPNNISDYTITAASINLLVNATAKSYVGCGGGDVWHWEGVEVAGDVDMNGFIEGDYIKFFVRLANLNRDVDYSVAEYQTTTLGQDGAQIADSYDYLNDTIFESDDMNDLIFFLNQVLKNGDYQNFYIIIGIEYNCEDNCSTDLDEFPEAYIKECNFNVTYVKKINQLTSLSWKYLGDQIDNKGGIVEIRESKLYFDYRIDSNWPTEYSPNSEFRILINDQEHSESIKLSGATNILRPGKVEGFDITKLVPNDKSINISIQVYLADNFDLNESRIISIDNVIFDVKYDIFFRAVRDTTFVALTIAALIASGLLGAYFILYRRVLRFPLAVRKVRKYGKSLDKTSAPNVSIEDRQKAYYKKYQKETKKGAGMIGSKPSVKQTLKSPEKETTQKPKVSKQMIIVIFIIMGLIASPILLNTGKFYLQKGTNLTLSQEEDSGLFTRESYYEEWIDNSEFDNSDNWTSIGSGDLSDVEASISGSNANYLINGSTGSQDFIENGTSSGWLEIENDDGLPKPGDFAFGSDGMDSTGWYATYDWPDNQPQSLKVQWQKNFTMIENMTDYVITSASLEAYINATVQATPVNGGGIDRPGDTLDGGTTVQIGTGDFARFFVLISDTDKTREFVATEYQTDALGRDDPIPITQLNDTQIVPINEETLIFFLEQALQTDHQNFAITLGTYIWCEDSGHPGDGDDWQMLLIKNFSLSLTYEKKIDQFTSLSWDYEGKQLEVDNYTIEVKDAKLFLEYKIDPLWVSSQSPNAHLKIYINDIVYNETIRLSEADTFFTQVKEEGFQVSNLIPIDEGIRVRIELFLADEFVLDREITLSIDNVELWIRYDVLKPTDDSDLFLLAFILISIGAAFLAAYTIYYQLVLKYPKQVRKVRKYRKTLNKERAPDSQIADRKLLIKMKYRSELHKTKLIKKKPLKQPNVKEINEPIKKENSNSSSLK
ncbi:MAG: hypothetical protein ACTSP9_02700 [Promethearchaeota archaeon]